jgi:hypothetical protein
VRLFLRCYVDGVGINCHPYELADEPLVEKCEPQNLDAVLSAIRPL